jgi:hypothetical protein
MECLTKRQGLTMQETQETFTFRRRSFQSIVDDMVNGIIGAYKEAPAELKTFEEIAHWAGQHVLLTEKEDGRK